MNGAACTQELAQSLSFLMFYPQRFTQKHFSQLWRHWHFSVLNFFFTLFIWGRRGGEGRVDAELRWPSSFSDIFFFFHVLFKISVVSVRNILSPSAAQQAPAHPVVFRHLILYAIFNFHFHTWLTATFFTLWKSHLMCFYLSGKTCCLLSSLFCCLPSICCFL